MMHHATRRGFKDCPKCAPLAHPLKGHRWGTGPKRCPARARRANVPPIPSVETVEKLPRGEVDTTTLATKLWNLLPPGSSALNDLIFKTKVPCGFFCLGYSTVGGALDVGH